MKRNDYLDPEEYKDGYYCIPGYSNYVINKKGDVKRKDTWESLVQNTMKVYNIVTLRDDRFHKTCNSRQWRVHRLMAITFLYLDDYDFHNLEVNHKDRNHKNNNLENLEWVTRSENMRHVFRTVPYINPDMLVPIQVRNYLTKEIKEYPSIRECSQELGIPKDTVRLRASKNPLFVWSDNLQFRKTDFDKPWPEPSHNDKTNYLIRSNRAAVLVKEHKKDGLVTEFNSCQDAADYLGISRSTFSTWVTCPGQPVLPGLIQVQLKDAFEDWREVKDPWLEYTNFQNGKRAVQAINDETGASEIYETAKELANKHGILATTLDWRLKSQGKITYSNGYRYGYYPLT